MLSFDEFYQKAPEIRRLAERTSGPFYVYSLEAIDKRIAELKTAMPADVTMLYSFKANSHPTIVESIRKAGLQADVASNGELEVALSTGFSPKDIEFTGPGKTPDELAHAVKVGVGSIIVESVQELVALEAICKKLGTKISVQIRLNPRVKLNASGRALKNEASHFGIDEEDTLALRAAMSSCSHVNVVGTHCHTQSQFLSAQHIIENFEYALEAASRFSKETATRLHVVNLGGGFGIPYSENQTPLDLEQFRVSFIEFMEKARSRQEFQGVQFRIELGRYFTGEAGAFITRVLYTKSSRGKKFAITDGGFTQSQIACGVGQLVRRNLPIRTLATSGQTHHEGPINREALTNRETISIAGPSCYGLDILAEDIELPILHPGDLVCIHNVGAYGYSFSPIEFLRQQRAHEYFI